MAICVRCGRTHSGTCGIPSRLVRVGMGVGSKAVDNSGFSYKSNPKKEVVRKVKRGKMLEDLLNWGEQEEQKALDMLKILSPNMPEYDELVVKLSALQSKIAQIKGQIAVCY